MKTLLLLLVSLITSPAHAQFDWTPEYRSFTESEPQDFQTFWEVNATYHSDAMTYVFLPEWQHRWLRQKRSFNMTFGSLSSKQFLMDRHIRLSETIASWLEFRVNYFDQKTFEDDQMHLYIEPVVWFKSWIGASIYFEPEFQKRNDNIGYSLLFKPWEESEIKLFYTDILFTRNDRNNLSDRFLTPLPKAFGLVARHVDADQFYELSFRSELPVRWNYPDSSNLYQYYRTMVQLMGSKKMSDRWKLNLRLLADRLSESATVTPAAESWLRDRVIGTLSASFYQVGPFDRWTITPGLHFAYRGWASNLGSVTLSQVIPQVWIDMPAFGEGDKEDTVSLGWDIDVFQPWASRAGIGAETRGTAWEHRLNTKYEVRLSEKISAIAMATFNINNLTSGSLHLFQGGCGQFQMLF